MAFWLRVLNPDNRFRYPLVTLGFDMCRLLWLRAGVPDKLFDTLFLRTKVRGDHQLVENHIPDAKSDVAFEPETRSMSRVPPGNEHLGF